MFNNNTDVIYYMEKTKEWITVKILKKQHSQINKTIKFDPNYTGVSDFIRDAIREKIVRKSWK